MASSPTVARSFGAPDRTPDAPGPVEQQPIAPLWLAFQSDESSAAATRNPGSLRHAVGPVLALLAVAGIAVRQLISNLTVAAPSTDAEAALGTNAYAFLNFPELAVPASLSGSAVSWQVAGYSVVTSATGPHDSVVGSTREFVLVLTVLTAVLTVAICRRLLLSWISGALAVALAGIPGIAALARILAAPAAIGAFWLAVAALSALVVADRQGRRTVAGPAGKSARTGPLTWLLIALSATASALAVLSSGVCALVLLGVALGFLTGRPLDHKWTLWLRGTAILGLSAALVGVSWVSVWGPAVGGTAISSLEGAGTGVGLGGLVLAAACSPISWLRPLAFAAVPILLAATWPGPAQAAALLLGLAVAAVLAAGLLDTLLGEVPSDFLSRRRFPVPARLAGSTLLVAGIAGALLIPSTASAAATPVPGEEVAAWIDTQLLPDAIVEVDPLTRAQLVREGLDATRLSTAAQDRDRDRAELRLGPLDTMPELPLLASFGSGPDALGMRLVVSDPAAFAEAQVADRAARSQFGAALATNPNLTLGPAATTALRAGDVDSRLMVGLAAASASVRVAIAEFTTSPAAPSEGHVLREVDITAITDLDPSVGANGTSPEALRWLGQFFETQQPPYQPLFVVEADSSITVGYAAPAPLGLLP